MSQQRKSITAQMENWLKAQVDFGKYGNDSEYFRDLLPRNRERRQAETQFRLCLMMPSLVEGVTLLQEKYGRKLFIGFHA